MVVVDQRSQVGGNCTHKGTIPSKALREAVKQMIDFNTNPMFREISEPRWLPYPHVLETANRVVSSQVRMRSKCYARNHVTVVHGTASFIDPHRVKVSQEQGDEIYHAKNDFNRHRIASLPTGISSILPMRGFTTPTRF